MASWPSGNEDTGPLETDPARIREAYARQKRRLVIAVAVCVPLALLLVFLAAAGGAAGDPAARYYWLGVLVLILGGGLFNWLNWSCPACGAWLGRSWGFPAYCPKCGAPLEGGG